MINDLKDDKSKDSTSSSDENEDSDNYFVQCLKIINKGLDHGKNEFIDDKTVQNLTCLAAVISQTNSYSVKLQQFYQIRM